MTIRATRCLQRPCLVTGALGALIGAVNAPASVQIITDPAAIQSVREAAAAERLRPKLEEQPLGEITWPDAAAVRQFRFDPRLRSQSTDAARRLAHTMKAAWPADPDLALEAASALLLIAADPDAWRTLVQVLRAGTDAQRLRVVHQFRLPQLGGHAVAAQPETAALLFACLGPDASVELRDAAVDAIGTLAIPGWELRFDELLAQQVPCDRADLFYWLAMRAPTPERLEALELELAGTKDAVRADSARRSAPGTYVAALGAYAASSDPALRSRALELARQVASRPDLRTVTMYTMTGHWDEASIPMLEVAVMDRSLEPAARNAALGDLVRLRGALARGAIERAMEDLDDAGHRIAIHGMDRLAALVEGSGDESAVEAIKRCLDAAKVSAGPSHPEQDANLRSAAAVAAVRIGGESGRALAAALAPTLDPYSLMRVRWALEGIDYEQAIQRLVEGGVIEPAKGAALRAPEVRQRLNSEYGTDCLGTVGSLLIEAEAGVGFDLEADEIPAPHDWLVSRFAKATGGALQVEAARQIWHRTPQQFDDSYTVQFIANGRLYQFPAEFRSDWFDSESVLKAINIALADNGVPQRFFRFWGGQYVYFMFATPEAREALSRTLHLAFASDPE